MVPLIPVAEQSSTRQAQTGQFLGQLRGFGPILRFPRIRRPLLHEPVFGLRSDYLNEIRPAYRDTRENVCIQADLGALIDKIEPCILIGWSTGREDSLPWIEWRFPEWRSV